MAKEEKPFATQLEQFEEHMIILRAAIRTGDTRMMAIAAVRFTSALLLFAVMPVFGKDARTEWAVQKRNQAFSAWLSGDDHAA